MAAAYDTTQPTSPADLALMRRMDKLHLEIPPCWRADARRFSPTGRTQVGRKYVRTLMKDMGVEAIYVSRRELIA